MRRGKSKPCVMSNLLIMHFIAKKRVMGKERKRKIVVTSDGTLFCRLQRRKRRGEREKEGEASKWDKFD